MDRSYTITESQRHELVRKLLDINSVVAAHANNPSVVEFPIDAYNAIDIMMTLLEKVQEQPTQILPGDVIHINGKPYKYANESEDAELELIKDVPDPDDIDSSKVGP